jgi:hypothetical protein
MNAKKQRWIKSLVETAKTTETKLPFERGNRAAVAARLRAKDARRAA